MELAIFFLFDNPDAHLQSPYISYHLRSFKITFKYSFSFSVICLLVDLQLDLVEFTSIYGRSCKFSRKQTASNYGQLLLKSSFMKLSQLPHLLNMIWGFPSGSAGKESAQNVGDLGSIPALGRSPGEGKGAHSIIHGLYSPWGSKESNMTERLSLLGNQKQHNHLWI